MKITKNKYVEHFPFFRAIFPFRVKIQRIFQAINFPNRLLSGNTDKKHKSSSLFFFFFFSITIFQFKFFFFLLAGCCLVMVLNRENVIPKEMRIVIRFLLFFSSCVTTFLGHVKCKKVAIRRNLNESAGI